MIMAFLMPLLTRWRFGLGIAGALAFLGLALAANHYRHAYHAEKALRAADRASYVAAQAEATLIAKQALDAAESRYRRNADNADKAFQSKLADARSAADRYVLSHRVRWEAVTRDASGTPAASASSGPGVPDSLSTTGILVSERDVQACTDATAYAIEAHNWAIGLIPPQAK